MSRLPDKALETLVRLFISKRRPKPPRWTGDEAPDSMEQAIDAAVGLRSCDKIHDHQYRVGRKALSIARSRLQHAKSQLGNAQDFDHLHMIVGHETEGVRRFGQLAKYDVADRLGTFLQRRPKHIYLHAGTREGAKAFNATGSKVDKSFFPRPLQKLSPSEIEDFLCIFADQLPSAQAPCLLKSGRDLPVTA